MGTGDWGDACIVPAFELYNFTFAEYDDDTFTTEATTNQQQANEFIYLKLTALDLPASKKFAIKDCSFIDSVDDGTNPPSTITYNMFNPEAQDCDNRMIDLT